MKVLTSKQIREADAYTIENEPISSVDLMERAAGQLFKWFKKNYSPDTKILIFAGPGNNGGDGWALARMLLKHEYSSVEVYLLNTTGKLSNDSEINRRRLLEACGCDACEIMAKADFPELDGAEIIVDALFGSGLSRPLEGLAAELVDHLNNRSGGELIAVDIPSGLFSEDNSRNQGSIIRANHTLTFQLPKLAFFFPENDRYLGRWYVLPIGLHPDSIQHIASPYHFTDRAGVSDILHPRKKFSHKGTYGHALLIAGSYGMMGAAVLAARAAIRSGPGLLTSHVPRLGVNIMQTTVPESLITIDESDLLFSEHTDLEGFSAVGIGPGLNQKPNTKKGLLTLLAKIQVPLLLDADALNLLAGTEGWTKLLPGETILTPHPREFERLFGSFKDSYSRLKAQIAFSVKYRCVIVLKGANTCITGSDGSVHFNSTGNPGMAKGGCGDVLSGIILGLLAQGYSCLQAAILGTYVHGFAGDLAAKKFGETGAIPSDIIRNIGKVFRKLEKKINR